MGTLRLRDLAVGMWLAGVDDVRELDPVLDEEDRDVVPDEVEVAVGRVELRREAPGSRTVSAEPRDPNTVEKRTNTGVSTPAARNVALVTDSAVPFATKTP
jgi:hypothetical protein